MWYTMSDSSKHYPLSIETVKRIKAQNKQGVKPEELETVEVITGKPKEVEPEYADLVGQISLKSLEKTTRKRRDKERGQQIRQQRPSQEGTPGQQRQPLGGNSRGPQQAFNRNRPGPPQQRNQQRPPQGGPQKPPSK